MKKILIILISFLLIFSKTYAESCSECKIKEAPIEELQFFFTNQRTVLNRAISLSKKNKKDKVEDFSRVKKYFLENINPLLDFDHYFEDLTYLLLNEQLSIPNYITRDRRLIERELDYLEETSIKVFNSGYGESIIDKKSICNGIPNCNINSNRLVEVIGEIINNNSRILSLYKNSIAGINTDNPNYLFVEDSFYQKIIENYNKNTITNCNSCEGQTISDIKKMFKKIAKNITSLGNSTKDWSRGWELFTNAASIDDFKKLEKLLLTKELAKQGLTRSQAEIILKNLDKYYESGGSFVENNFITNTVRSGWSFIVNTYDTYSSAIIGLRDNIQMKETKKVETENITSSVFKKSGTDNLYKNMQDTYIKLYKEAGNQTVIDEKSINELIKIHGTLAKIISNLKKTIPTSQEICKKQCRGVGNCDNY